MKLVIIIMALAFVLSACTSRVEYETPHAKSAHGAVNINTATIAELEQLPYVGTRTAEAIVEYRELQGPFRRPEHLMLIRGVSSKRFKEIRPLIRAD